MARCGGCAGAAGVCGCLIEAGDNVTITGTGSEIDPYVVNASASGGTFVDVSDSTSIDFSISGDGTVGTPYVVTGSVVSEAIQDIIGGALGDGLAYDDGANEISVCISSDAENQLIIGTDGCLYAAAADDTVFMTLHTAQIATGAKTWNLPDDQTTAIRINTQSVVDPNNSEDTFAIYWNGTVRSGWFNEWGGLRIFTINPANLGYSDQAIKLFSRQNVDTFQIIRANTSNIGFRLRDVATDHVQQYGGFSTWEALASFSNGFAAYAGTTYYSPAVRLTVGGDRAELRGRVETDGSPAAAQTVATIPASPSGMRPVRDIQVSAPADDGTMVNLDITSAGAVVCQTNGTYTAFSLDGIIYYTGAN